jgi:predicted  nucleic acid-binding Zn-ribbon protein
MNNQKYQWIKTAFVVLSVSGVPVMAQTAPPSAPPPVTKPASEDPVGPWAQAAIGLMIEKGLFVGYPGGSFDWTQAMTRQEAAMLIARLIAQYGLDKFDPEEIAVMQRAIAELQNALRATETRLQTQILELQRQIGALQQAQADDDAQLRARVETLEVQVQRLLEIIGALETGSGSADLTDALRRVDALSTRLDELERRQRELTAQIGAAERAGTPDTVQPQRQELGDVQTEMTRLNDELRALQTRVSTLENRVTQLTQENQALGARIAALEARGGGGGATQNANNTQTVTINLGGLGDLQRQSAEGLERLRSELETLNKRVTDLEKRVSALELRVTDLETRLSALEAAVREALQAARDALKAAQDAQRRVDYLLPVRAPFYVGVVVNRTFPLAGAQGRVIFGHDAILDNIGLRGNIEFSATPGAAPLSFSADLTSRFSLGASDGYIGAGLGVMFFDPLTLSFSELLVGMNYRLFHNVALFVEARLTSIFDANNTNLGAIDFGVQFRF